MNKWRVLDFQWVQFQPNKGISIIHYQQTPRKETWGCSRKSLRSWSATATSSVTRSTNQPPAFRPTANQAASKTSSMRCPWTEEATKETLRRRGGRGACRNRCRWSRSLHRLHRRPIRRKKRHLATKPCWCRCLATWGWLPSRREEGCGTSSWSKVYDVTKHLVIPVSSL